jgi:hypothetical protein
MQAHPSRSLPKLECGFGLCSARSHPDLTHQQNALQYVRTTSIGAVGEE